MGISWRLCFMSNGNMKSRLKFIFQRSCSHVKHLSVDVMNSVSKKAFGQQRLESYDMYIVQRIRFLFTISSANATLY